MTDDFPDNRRGPLSLGGGPLVTDSSLRPFGLLRAQLPSSCRGPGVGARGALGAEDRPVNSSPATAASPGDTATPDSLILYEAYVDADAFKTHQAAEPFKKFVADIVPNLVHRAVRNFDNVKHRSVDHVARRTGTSLEGPSWRPKTEHPRRVVCAAAFAARSRTSDRTIQTSGIFV